jgi:hypothetical protein
LRTQIVFKGARVNMKRFSFFIVVALAIVGALNVAAPGASDRPSNWAQPIDMAGVPNLHKISDVLYRSAQPTAEGMRNLKALGIETVINLRLAHSDRKSRAGRARRFNADNR